MKTNILAITFAVAALPLMTFAQANPPASSAGQNPGVSATKPAGKVKKHAVAKKPVKKNATASPAATPGK